MKEQGPKIGVATVTVTVLVVMLSLLCTCGAATCISSSSSSSSLHPLILIPGNGGNQLEARLTPQYKPSSFVCNTWYPLFKKKNGWFRLWFDSSVLLAPFTQCFAERMMLHYNPQLDDYYNTPGVQTRAPHFGSTSSLLYLNPRLKHVAEYMASLVDSLEQLGYIDGETLFGAPYDFRYGLAAEGHPSQVGSKFLEDLKSLIEAASTSNGGKPVILVSHSLGGLFALQLLSRNHPSWGKKYVKHFVALSAPWGGAMDEMLTFASGNTLGVPLVDPLTVRAEHRSSESNLWLLPNPNVYGRKKLVITQHRSYSAHDMVDFLKDIGFPEGVYPYETRILPLIEKIEAPEIPITCIIGTGVRTPESLFYRNGDFDERPEVSYGDGDGTVNMVSLLALQSLWGDDEKNQSLKVIKIGGVSHISMLKDDVALDKIIGEISRINSQSQLGFSQFFMNV